jgi:hypothetical protein
MNKDLYKINDVHIVRGNVKLRKSCTSRGTRDVESIHIICKIFKDKEVLTNATALNHNKTYTVFKGNKGWVF